MLFAKGVWSVFGIRASSLDAFRAGMADKAKLIGMSQLVASVRTKFGGAASVGINPYEEPRKDETVAGVELTELADQIAKEAINDSWHEFAGTEEQQFSLGDNQYAFWVVFNDFEDVTDPK